MQSKVFFICSRGAYMIFLPGEAENITFAIARPKVIRSTSLGKNIVYAQQKQIQNASDHMFIIYMCSGTFFTFPP